MFLENKSSHKQDAWNQFCREMEGGLELDKYTLFGRVTYILGSWGAVLDTYSSTYGSVNKLLTEYTRIRVPFQNYDNFTCEIYNSSLTSKIGKIFGMQDIEIGDDYFDEQYIIKASDEVKILRLLKIEEIKILIRKHPNIHIRVNSDDRLFSMIHPEARNEVIIETNEIISDIYGLRIISKLMLLILNNLCKSDSMCTRIQQRTRTSII